MARKLALIIGNSHYQDANLARLVAPGEDVTDLTDVLRDAAIGAFDEVIPLIDESDATIRLSIEDFFADKKPDDLLVVYFSGHGVRDEQGQLYLAVNNTRANRLRATAIPSEFITKEMDRSRSKRQVLILDCCHSGAFAQGAKAVTGESAGTGPAFEGSGYGRVVLTATDATQYAWEGDRIIGEADNSLFTHFMVEGLRTGAADTDGDGQITLDEMYDYVYEQVVTQTPKQTPGKWSYKQQGDIVIARNPRPIVRPVELPTDVQQLLDDPRPQVREAGVRELAQLLHSDNPGLVLTASQTLKKLSEDDSLRVRTTAAQILKTAAPPESATSEAIYETAPRLPAITSSRLVVRTGIRPGQHFALRAGVNVIGRGPAAEVSLADDNSVSRRHSQIVAQGDRFTLEDLGSANGTFFNGQRLAAPRVLREGDTIAIGDTTLVFEPKSATPTPVRETPGSIPAATGETRVEPSVEIGRATPQLKQPAPVISTDRARAESPIVALPSTAASTRPPTSQLKRGWVVAGVVAVLAIMALVIIQALNQPANEPVARREATIAPTLETTPAGSTDVPQAASAPTKPIVLMAAPTSIPTMIPIAPVTQVSDKDGMTLLYVPAGEFTMGNNDSNNDEKPMHAVYLDAFWIDQTEVTNGLYAKCVTARACQAPPQTESSTHASYYGNPQFDTYPVVNVDWNDAKKYCEWAGGDLPTEAQWEKAARGTDGRLYPWGNDAPDKTRLNYNKEVGDTTQVGIYPTGASPYGALDMAGNVWEWVTDTYAADYYASSPNRNPAGPTLGKFEPRVLRGGSWSNEAALVRASFRDSDYPFRRVFLFGFRCAR